jgi:hypothetical protein
MSLTGKTIGELTELSAITETTLFPVEFSGATFYIPYSSITTNIKPYKVYTALLTQNGSGDTQNLSSGAVTKGVTYQISGVGFDCTNVGAPNNDNGTYFVATNNEVPTTYGAGSLEYNTGAPVVTVLENTIGNIWFTYSSTGTYFINSDTLFTDDKTTFSINLMGGDIGTGYFCLGEFNGDSSLGITTGSPEYGEIDDVLSNTTPIEIRVYN